MKKVFSHKSTEITEFPGCHSHSFFNSENSPCDGYYAMYNYFYNTDYITPYGVHEDHEGFYVVAGTGKMIIGNGPEFDLLPGVSMVAPAGVPHAFKKTSQEDLEIFLFHFPK